MNKKLYYKIKFCFSKLIKITFTIIGIQIILFISAKIVGLPILKPTSIFSYNLFYFSILNNFLVIFFFLKNERLFHLFKSLFLISFTKKIQGFFWGNFLGFCIAIFSFSLIILFSSNIINFDFSYEIVKLPIFYLIILLLAFSEEILVRFIIQHLLKINEYKLVSLISASLCFSVLHLLNPNITFLSFITIFLSGLLLGFLFFCTKNIFFVTALHTSWNFTIGCILGSRISGILFPLSIIKFSYLHESIINGGGFGIEGSIFTALSYSAVLIVIYINREYLRKIISA